MKPNELRIGNWAQDDEGIPGIISTISQDRVVIKGVGDCWVESEVFGVPLTDEWLEDFGFRKRIESDTLTWFRKNKRTIAKEKGIFYFMEPTFWVGGRKMLYVHTLQNLYYALTGEELKLID